LKNSIFTKYKESRPVKPIRYRLTASFIMLTVVLIVLLWLMQSVFLDWFYQYSMQGKVSGSLSSVEKLYNSDSELTYTKFCEELGSIASNADVMIYVEAQDGSFSITSADQSPGGRFFPDSRRLINDIKTKLAKSTTCEASSTSKTPGGNITYVHAKQIDSETRVPVIIYVMAFLSPIGPAVGIIRTQLLIISIIAVAFSILLARWLSKRLASPIAGMSIQAKELAKGNYDINFDGGHEMLEVDQLADTLTKTASELKKADSLQKDLMANVSHDLRTPLTMIKSYAEMIRDLSGDIPEKRDEHLSVIIDETDRLSELVNDVLTLSKMQAGVIELEKADFDIQKSAESVLSTFMIMEQEGFKISFNSLPQTIMVNGDERKIQRVIANLISNAVRYSKDEKEISLSFEEKDHKVKCLVSDKGIGIAKEDLEKIWHRYERASSTAQRSENGSGLGLSIAAEILNKHNSAYGVESEEGKGSTFWFELEII